MLHKGPEWRMADDRLQLFENAQKRNVITSVSSTSHPTMIGC